MNVKRYTEHNVEHSEFLPPDGFAIVHEQHPSINDNNSAAKYCLQLAAVLRSAGIESAICPIDQKNLAPMGSGPGGRVRFGDSMMPSVHRVFVPADKVPAALEAIQTHRQAVREWLYNGGKMPDACRQ